MMHALWTHSPLSDSCQHFVCEHNSGNLPTQTLWNQGEKLKSCEMAFGNLGI